MLYKMSYKEKKRCTFLEIQKISKKKSLNNNFASHWPRTRVSHPMAPAVRPLYYQVASWLLQGNFSLSLHGSNPGLDCKTLFLDSYTLSGVVMRRATWSLAGASKVLPSLRELGNIVSLPPKLLQRLNKPPGSFPCSIEAKCSTQEALEQVDFGCAARV